MHYVYLATDDRGKSWPMLTSTRHLAPPECQLELRAITDHWDDAFAAWEDLLAQVKARDRRSQR